MNNLEFLRRQEIELSQLLANAAGDDILSPQYQSKLDEIQQQIDELAKSAGELFPFTPISTPRAAIFLSKGGVEGSSGIRPFLAGEALIQYERMFIEQAIHDERIAARATGRRRRPRGATTPGLLFTGTPRGSFGLEFVPQPTDDPTQIQIHADSLKHVAESLLEIGGADFPPLDERVAKIPPKLMRPLKQFFKVLADCEAELRLSFSDTPARVLTAEQIQGASAKLDRELKIEEIEAPGTFRGVTRETGYFDLVTEGLGLVSGHVADGLTEDDLERISDLTNHRCIAHLLKTVVAHFGGDAKTSYVLIDAFPVH